MIEVTGTDGTRIVCEAEPDFSDQGIMCPICGVRVRPGSCPTRADRDGQA